MRVPRTTHAPPQRSGTLSASGHCDQSIMAALSGSWMSNHARQSMLQSIMRGLGLFVSYDKKGSQTRCGSCCAACFGVAARTLRRPAGFHARHFAPYVAGRLVFPQPFMDDLPQQIVFGPGEELHLGD